MTRDTAKSLLGRLADGRCHSGAELGASLGRSRAAVWKQVRQLRAMGVLVDSHRGRGYALKAPLELLSADAIRDRMDPAAARLYQEFQVEFSVDSTSRRLLEAPPPVPGRYRVLLAEHQSGGRGRRGRRWFSPLGHGLCFSLSWLWESPPRDLAALGLVMGVTAAEVLADSGAAGIGLKWPNDLVARGGKLGGILVDVAGEASGPLKVVAGIGINVRHSDGLTPMVLKEAGALAPVAVEDLAGGAAVSRNALAGRLLQELAQALGRFSREGFLPFADRWRRLDWLYGRPVAVTAENSRRAGIARGIGTEGELLLEQDGVVTAVLAGDVSLRESP